MRTIELSNALAAPAVLLPSQYKVLYYRDGPNPHRAVGVVYRAPGLHELYYVSSGNLSYIPHRLIEEVAAGTWPRFNNQYPATAIYQRATFEAALRTVWTLICKHYGTAPGPLADDLNNYFAGPLPLPE